MCESAEPITVTLLELVRKNLVVPPDDLDGRYGRLETVRLYAQQRLVESGEAGLVRERHLCWFADLAGIRAGILTSNEADWVATTDRETPNLLGALRWANETTQWATALQISADIAEEAWLRGRGAFRHAAQRRNVQELRRLEARVARELNETETAAIRSQAVELDTDELIDELLHQLDQLGPIRLGSEA
ncbi:MAG: hypothetical protein GY798_05570 [Hyphomicrobiales bacterium]|nr:hypothetical protein [Hyphomicrobiales bacterium]